jgi:hypothetical protein
VVLVGFGMASAHMLTDGDCEYAPAGPSPENGVACLRAGGAWNPSHGFWHDAYEFGHVPLWPLIILIALALGDSLSSAPGVKVSNHEAFAMVDIRQAGVTTHARTR